jgi:hypothetical protein
MTLMAYLQERFWSGFAVFAARTGVAEKIDKLIADKLEEAPEAELAKMTETP